ncbi:MAG: family 10 glycosylhydrolase [Planctomycetes bacterium]|nr:family 10 glycosylhydrolase [Planctomycetota bacterium]
MTGRRRIHVACLAVLAWANALVPAADLRGIWMHATQTRTRAETERAVARIESANLNAVFILVWYWGGQAFFRTPLAPMGDGVEAGHDPLGAMVELCHRRGIEVHAWFVNGAYGAPAPGRILEAHPDWAVDSLTGEIWYDLGKPAVRAFQCDLMLGCLKAYDIDGIQFDYIRYGPIDCWCPHCQEEFAKRYGSARDGETLGAFPAVARASGNPLVEPTTARVLVEFGDGKPALAINTVGKGKVLILNWHAEQSMPGAAAATTTRLLQAWRAPKGRVLALNTRANRERYGDSFAAAGARLFARLGYQAQVVDETRLVDLSPATLLILPAPYIIPDDAARRIEAFLEAGGIAVAIDGPVLSMPSAVVRRIFGFERCGGYFRSDLCAFRSTGRSEFAASSERPIDLAQERIRAKKWAEYRAWGVTQLVRDVHAAAKAAKPSAPISAAVFTPLEAARRACQDWPAWIRDGIIDFVVPMAYTMDNVDLARQIREWKTVDPALDRIVPGLSIYVRDGRDAGPRAPAVVLSQYELCRKSGARGNLFFSLHYLADPLIEALRKGPFAAPPSR